MTVFSLPDLGEGLQEAEIVAWHVAPGHHVTADQPLVAVETEKAVVEIPSPRSGRIKALLAELGDIVKVGAPLVEFADAAAEDTGTVVGELAGDQSKSKPERLQAATNEKAHPAATADRIKAAPAVRRLADRLGVDLAKVTPTGAHGEISLQDIKNSVPSTIEQPTEDLGGTPLRGPRRTMARHMADAHARVVPASITEDADIHAWSEGTRPVLRMIRAAVAGCRAAPTLNAWYDDDADTLLPHHHVDLGIAIDSEEGLFVPVLRHADALTLEGLAEALDVLEDGVRRRSLSPEAFTGATLTLSNFGVLGGRYGIMTVLPPQTAILGAGRIRPGLVASEGTPAIRNVLPLSLTFDHRVITGGEAARFLAAVVADLVRPD
jgi:2-oxoisovalerate dehydrogenase E2 component (dihydrolipoyl transacylase)